MPNTFDGREWGAVGSSDEAGAPQLRDQSRTWSSRSVRLGMTGVISGALGLCGFASYMSIPAAVGGVVAALFWLSVPLAIGAIVCAVIGLNRGEGRHALPGLAIGVIGFAPVPLLIFFLLRFTL